MLTHAEQALTAAGYGIDGTSLALSDDDARLFGALTLRRPLSEGVTAHMQRATALVHHLAGKLKINVRDHWRPNAAWLSSFQKIQLAHLIAELEGPVHAPALDPKKSALVEVLSKLFADGAEGKLKDQQLAERVNAWLPSNLRAVKEEATGPQHRSQKRS